MRSKTLQDSDLDSDQGGRLSGDLLDQATKPKLALRSSIGRSVDRQLLHFSPTRLQQDTEFSVDV